MKTIAALILVPAVSVVSGGLSGALIFVAVIGWVCSVFAALSYLLIMRRGVAPRVEWGKGKFRIWFEHLWPTKGP